MAQMLTILIANQKGGVGKTTIADELAFELERRGASVSFISTDPQGGSVHETDDGDKERDWRIVDTPGVLADALPEWCEAADMVLVPMLPSPRHRADAAHHRGRAQVDLRAGGRRREPVQPLRRARPTARGIPSR